MAVWPVADAGLQAMGGQLTASSLLTTVAASATPNALGSWVEMHNSVAFPVSGLRTFVGKGGIAVSLSNAQVLFDIGIGLSGFEVPIAQDIAIGGALPFSSWELPLSIPMSSRICVRLRSVVASKSTTMGMQVWGGGTGTEGGFKAITYGQVVASSRGTILTAPGAINTEAAWTVITTGISFSIRWLLVGLAAPNTTTTTACDHLIDIGVGGAGVEAAIITDIPCTITANEDINHPKSLLFPVNLPAGSRLVARSRGTSIAAGTSPSVTLTGIS